ncbi:MAG: hypothetical protein Q4G50_14065, partial [Corynebacterium sp.]|nr:hypothetical protein [Corynebacterium sp.]
MSTLQRFAPLLAILGLLVLVAAAGSVLANNSSAPNIDPAGATITRESSTPVTVTSTLPSPTAQEPAPAPEPHPAP